MKKLLPLGVLAAILAAGCASTGSTTATTANKTMTLEEALQKSAETRQKLMDAKQSYQNAKTAAEVASGQKSAVDVAKEQLQQKADATKKQIADEKAAWAELLGK
ncbi:MAG: hypothetical protein Q4P84_04530 [Elusimicrobiales bacterium]|uniref:hypothetical protein n=1 Tax=Candidatus Avelusimicrobium sp. TaxID=3048833 RepID=UPI00270667F9|nr:hypothetical protein [Elusimicrobiota bacterium]MDD7578792.1 hypothetical protein [Elusimicrobiota bacterium]MDO5764957.1 hypothetical protein [Elusimicrobiales bacterium]MDY6039818.1 hypothetical protein [Elusimicrobiaceae bacterium]